jgi:hypothetical protein
VRLSQVNKANRDEDAHNDADGKHPEHELCSPAPVHAVASHDLSMAERQILCDAVNVGWCENRRLSQRPAAFGAFALKQMAPACPVKLTFPLAVILKRFATDFLVLIPLGRRIQFHFLRQSIEYSPALSAV